MRELILEWINELAPEQRVCVKLAHVDKLNAAEIARRTGWSEHEVHRHLKEGRANLRKRSHNPGAQR